MTAGEPPRGRRLRRPTGLTQRATIFGLSVGFYLLLGDLVAYDVVTGVATGLAVSVLLARVTFTAPPTLGRTLPRVARATVFLPYLLWRILVANLALAAVLLDPRLPIEPSVETVDAGDAGDLELAVLANSVTLTPGTLAVDVRNGDLLVHALGAGSRRDLRAGDLQRAVRFVFRGRAKAPGAESRATGDDAAEEPGR